MNRVQKQKFTKQKKRCKALKKKRDRVPKIGLRPISRIEANRKMMNIDTTSIRFLGIFIWITIHYRALVDCFRGVRYSICRFPGDSDERICLMVDR